MGLSPKYEGMYPDVYGTSRRSIAMLMVCVCLWWKAVYTRFRVDAIVGLALPVQSDWTDPCDESGVGSRGQDGSLLIVDMSLAASVLVTAKIGGLGAGLKLECLMCKV